MFENKCDSGHDEDSGLRKPATSGPHPEFGRGMKKF